MSLLLLLVAPGLGCPPAEPLPDDGPAACEYPSGATEPMEFGEVLTPYAWPTALAVGGDESVVLELEDVPCTAGAPSTSCCSSRYRPGDPLVGSTPVRWQG